MLLVFDAILKNINGEDRMYKNRAQMFNPKLKRWVKLDTETGRILSYKSDKKPYKNIEMVLNHRDRAGKLLAGMGWTLEEIATHMEL